jgi:hypothetical protein
VEDRHFLTIKDSPPIVEEWHFLTIKDSHLMVEERPFGAAESAAALGPLGPAIHRFSSPPHLDNKMEEWHFLTIKDSPPILEEPAL